MKKSYFIYIIFFLLSFLTIEAYHKAKRIPTPVNNGTSQRHPILPNDLIIPCNGGAECLVTVLNNCSYPIYLFEIGQGLAPLVTPPANVLQPGQAGGYYPVEGLPNLPQRAIQVGAGKGIVGPSYDCNISGFGAGLCELGWGNQGTLFEFTYNPPGSSADTISYDISAVNGFDFPMTIVVTNPVGGNKAGGCTEIDTGNLDVSNNAIGFCSNYMNLYGTESCVGPNNKCVRQAIHASDFQKIFSGGTDCYLPDDTTPVTACRAPRTFGVNYYQLFPGPSCKGGGSLDYTITPQSLLTRWTCTDPTQPNDSNSLCWPHAGEPSGPLTSYYLWIKNAVGYGQNYTSIYAFPQDDGYSTHYYNGSVVGACTALTPRFTLVIGPIEGGASGKCPPLPSP